MSGPILVTPGQTVASDQWDALTQQHGGLPNVGQPLAADDPAVLGLLSRPGMGATLKQHPIYRYYFADGTYVDAYTDENGQDSHIVDYKPSARFTQQHPAAGTAAGGTNTHIGVNPVSGRPTEVTEYPDGRPPTYDDTRVPAAQAAQATTPHIEGTPTGKDASGTPTFDNTKPIMVERDANGQQVGPAKPLTTEQRQQWERDKNGGKSDQEIRDAQKPGTPTQATDGSWGYWDHSSGTPTWKPITGGPAGKKYTEVKQDPQTGKWSGLTAAGTWELMEGGPGLSKNPNAKMPAGVTPPTSFEYGKAASQLADFWRQLNEAVTRGDITGDEAVTLFAPYHQQAQTAITEQQNVLTNQRGVMQDETTQRGQDLSASTARGTQASGIFNNSMNQMTDLNKYVKPGSDSAGRAFLASLKLGQQYVGDMGGQVNPGHTQMLPAVQQAMQAGLNGGAPPSLAPSINAAFGAANTRLGAASAQPPAPAATPAAAPIAPAAAVSPVAPPAAAPTATAVPTRPMLPAVQAAMQQPQAADGNERPDDILTLWSPDGTINQITRAQYETGSPETRAAYTVINAEANPSRMGAPTGGTPSLGQGQDLSTPPMQNQMPVNVTPPSFSGDQSSSMLPSVQTAMQPQYDPEHTAGWLLAHGFDPDVVDTAHRQRYGQSIYGAAA